MVNYEPDSGMDPCPSCGSQMESVSCRVVARCPDCSFRSFLADPRGWVRFLTEVHANQ